MKEVDELYLQSIKVYVGRFEIRTSAIDSSIVISTESDGMRRAQRFTGLTPKDCRHLGCALSEYLHMQSIEEAQ